MINSDQIPELLAALQDLIMGSTVVKCAATDLGLQWAGWALAAAFKTEKFYDLAGTLMEKAHTWRPVLLVTVDLQPCAACADCFHSLTCYSGQLVETRLESQSHFKVKPLL